MLHSLKDIYIYIIFLYSIPYINQPASDNSSDPISTPICDSEDGGRRCAEAFQETCRGGRWRSFPNSVLI